MLPVISSNAKAVGYDKENKNLYVTFRGDSTYVYYKVPKLVYKSLIEADSFGSMLNERVKGRYSYGKVKKE